MCVRALCACVYVCVHACQSVYEHIYVCAFAFVFARAEDSLAFLVLCTEAWSPYIRKYIDMLETYRGEQLN